MSDASYPVDPQDFAVLPGRRVRDLSFAECEQAVAILNAERDAIMAQMKRHEADPSSRAPGWRLSAQSALGWKKRVRTAINVRAQELKAGPKAKAAARLRELRRLAEHDGPCAVAADSVRQKADALAETMKAIHGGEWRVQIEHDAGFVLVCPV